MLYGWKGILLELISPMLPTEETLAQIAEHIRSRGLLDEKDVEAFLQEARTRAEKAVDGKAVGEAVATARLITRSVVQSLGIPSRGDLDRIVRELEKLGQRVEALSTTLEKSRPKSRTRSRDAAKKQPAKAGPPKTTPPKKRAPKKDAPKQNLQEPRLTDEPPRPSSKTPQPEEE